MNVSQAVVSTSSLAFDIYGALKDSSGEFRNLSGDVGQLCLILRETEALVVEDGSAGSSLDTRRKEQLGSLAHGIKSTLVDLEKLLDKYESMDEQAKKSYDQLHYGAEDITALRARLGQHRSTP